MTPPHDEQPSTTHEPITTERREFLRSLGKWSQVVRAGPTYLDRKSAWISGALRGSCRDSFLRYVVEVNLVGGLPVKRLMRSLRVIQVNKAIPIILNLDKSITHGTLGMAVWFPFETHSTSEGEH